MFLLVMKRWLVHSVLDGLKVVTDKKSDYFSEVVHKRVNDCAGECYRNSPNEGEEHHWYAALRHLAREMTFALGRLFCDDVRERESEVARNIPIPDCACDLFPRGDEQELAFLGNVLPCTRIFN